MAPHAAPTQPTATSGTDGQGFSAHVCHNHSVPPVTRHTKHSSNAHSQRQCSNHQEQLSDEWPLFWAVRANSTCQPPTKNSTVHHNTHQQYRGPRAQETARRPPMRIKKAAWTLAAFSGSAIKVPTQPGLCEGCGGSPVWTLRRVCMCAKRPIVACDGSLNWKLLGRKAQCAAHHIASGWLWRVAVWLAR